jgi:hypothetical protein
MHWLKWISLFCLALAAIGIAWPLLESATNTAGTCYRFGPLQALCLDKEAWVFLEVDRIAFRSGRLASPTTLSNPDELVVCRVNSTGVIQCVETEFTNINLNPNCFTLFSLENRIYINQVANQNQRATIYEWRGKSFSHLTEQEQIKLIRQYGLGEWLRRNCDGIPPDGIVKGQAISSIEINDLKLGLVGVNVQLRYESEEGKERITAVGETWKETLVENQLADKCSITQ